MRLAASSLLLSIFISLSLPTVVIADQEQVGKNPILSVPPKQSAAPKKQGLLPGPEVNLEKFDKPLRGGRQATHEELQAAGARDPRGGAAKPLAEPHTIGGTTTGTPMQKPHWSYTEE
jgi:hypothetical protein